MSRKTLTVAALAAVLALSACQDGGPAPSTPLPALEIDAQAVEEARLRAEQAVLRRANQERGWACGYDEAWEGALGDARDLAPDRWRSAVFGGVVTLGLIAFALGLLGVFLLALLLPRLRRKATAEDEDEQPSTGAFAVIRHGLSRALGALARLLRVELFDSKAADARVDALHECRDARRQLAAAAAAVRAVGGKESPRTAEVVGALTAWSDDLAVLVTRLEDHGLWAPPLDPTHLLPRLVKTRRAAQQLRVECVRAEVAGTRPDDATWATWAQLIDGRPVLPVDRARDARRGPLPNWTRPVGWAGVAALAVMLPMSAAWTAAGAFPLFFTLLFALAGLGATFTARFLLLRAGRAPLLPGAADRIARTLTWLAVFATALVMASSLTASESGLDLGDPPPVERPAELRTPPMPTVLRGEVAPGTAPTPAPPTAPAVERPTTLP